MSDINNNVGELTIRISGFIALLTEEQTCVKAEARYSAYSDSVLSIRELENWFAQIVTKAKEITTRRLD